MIEAGLRTTPKYVTAMKVGLGIQDTAYRGRLHTGIDSVNNQTQTH